MDASKATSFVARDTPATSAARRLKRIFDMDSLKLGRFLPPFSGDESTKSSGESGAFPGEPVSAVGVCGGPSLRGFMSPVARSSSIIWPVSELRISMRSPCIVAG